MRRRQPDLREYIEDHIRYYAGIGLGMVICLLVVGAGVALGWLSMAAFALAILLVLIYFLAGSLLTANRKVRAPDYDFLFQMGDIQPTEQLILPYVRRRDAAVALSRRLTTGRIFGIDLYNPQLTPDPALPRAGRRWRHPPKDPRIEWLDGSLDILPLPDSSVSAAILDDVLCQFWQEGDRQRLLWELRRVLRPGGRLLVAERTRSLSNWLALGPVARSLPEPEYWRGLMAEAQFTIQQESSRHDLSTCWRAVRPAATDEVQLAFDFGSVPLGRPKL